MTIKGDIDKNYVIISTADPSGGSNGMLWIKYTP